MSLLLSRYSTFHLTFVSLFYFRVQLRKLIDAINEFGAKGPSGQMEVAFGLLFVNTDNRFEVCVGCEGMVWKKFAFRFVGRMSRV